MKLDIKKLYGRSWNYLKESKSFVYAIIYIFVFSALVGFIFPAPDFLVERIRQFMEEIISKTEGMGWLELSWFIFSNNIQSSFIGLVSGIIAGIPSIIISISNGYLIGFVSAASVKSVGIFSLWRLLPHGIFELPAIFISLGLGLRIGTFIFMKKKKETFIEVLANSLLVFVLIVLPLLVVAALIEGVLIFFLR